MLEKERQEKFLSQHLLSKGVVMPYPRQNNSIDCGLFCVGITMHLLQSLPILQTFFSQKHSTSLRLDIISLCNITDSSADPTRDPFKHLPSEFIRRYFPLLSNGEDYVNNARNQPLVLIRSTKKKKKRKYEKDNSRQQV